MCDVYEKETGLQKTSEDIFSYDVDESFPAIKELIANGTLDAKNTSDFFFNQHSEDCFLNANAISAVKKSIDKIREMGYRVAICTHQPLYNGRLHTLTFLSKNDIHYDELHFTREKWRIQADYIIDDSPEFLTDLREKARKICIDYPFNRSLSQFSFEKSNRFKNVSDALSHIIEKEGQI
jgi:5'(3')-deoxyribonucleotidase